jgi:hypothetical protein
MDLQRGGARRAGAVVRDRGGARCKPRRVKTSPIIPIFPHLPTQTFFDFQKLFN